jgi:hypothetical protein
MRENTKAYDRDDLEFRLATTLAPMLLTVVVFCLTAVNIVTKPASTIVDEMLSLIAAFCIFAAALLVDFILDKLKIATTDRVSFLNYGYISFCVVVMLTTITVPTLYLAKQSGDSIFSPSIVSMLYFTGAGLCVFGKMMVLYDKNTFVVGMVIFYTLSIGSLVH